MRFTDSHAIAHVAVGAPVGNGQAQGQPCLMHRRPAGGLGLLGLYINENNVALINQILEALTEYCQVKMLLGFL